MTAKCDWTHTQTNDRELVMWSDTDRGSEPPLTSLDVIHPGQTAVKVGMFRQPTSHPNVRERLSTRDCLKPSNELKWLKTLKLIKTYCHTYLDVFVYSECMVFEELFETERGLLCAKNAFSSVSLRPLCTFQIFIRYAYQICNAHARSLSDAYTRSSLMHILDVFNTV